MDREHEAARRVLDAVGDPELLVKLAGVPGTDLTSFLLALMRARATGVTAPEVLRRYRSDRFVAPAQVDLAALRAVEDAFLFALPDGWDALKLSPLVPFATHAATADVTQDRLVATIRGTEVAADPTNALALEAAVRRRVARTSLVRLATVQRVTRGQHFDAVDAWAHFSVFALVTTGRDSGGRAFDRDAMIEHVSIHLDGIRRTGGEQIRLILTDLTGGERAPTVHAVEDAVGDDAIEIEHDPARDAGRYYEGLCFKIRARFGDSEFEVADGGFTDWMTRLLADRREHLCISGSGLDRVAIARQAAG